jgi:micrococcal nuclease
MKKRVYCPILLTFLLLATVLAVLLAGPLCAENIWQTSHGDFKHVKVAQVVNTDSIVLENGVKIRLIGIKPLEKPKKENVQVDQYGFVIEQEKPEVTVNEKAWAFVRELLENKYVNVEFDSQRNDERFHNWGYVFLADKTFVNAEILRQGFAEMQIQPPNMKYADLLRAAYQEARQEKRGLHGE